jgi:hypothetical protein
MGEDNIKMDLKEIGWEGVDWIHLVRGRENWRVLITGCHLRFHKTWFTEEPVCVSRA